MTTRTRRRIANTIMALALVVCLVFSTIGLVGDVFWLKAAEPAAMTLAFIGYLVHPKEGKS